ncbi:MAG: hypothetical protein O7B30_04370 [Thaumarchaeota archaeon]|jgi:hypothetical protein|nr:hypothetical protein [Nitrososphaerota archaeon]
MLSRIFPHFTRRRSRMEVVKKMIEFGISVTRGGELKIGNLNIQDTSLAESAGVDRRVVRSTVGQILSDSELGRIFERIRPVGTSLVETAALLGYHVLLISGDAFQAGIISEVSSVLAENGLVIRQALADDPDMITEPRLTFVVSGDMTGNVLSKLQALPSVRGLTLVK